MRWRGWRRFLGDERGAVSIIFIFCATALIGAAAVAVDFGSVYLETRKLQGVADLAALSAAEDPANAHARVNKVVRTNGYTGKVYARIVVGTYVPDPAEEAGRRFVAGGNSPNAVQVSLRTNATLFFGANIIGADDIAITRTATAANAQLASFSIGSRLVSLNGGVANTLLTALTGSKVSLSVMDYRALLSADVGLFDYLSALKTDLRLQAASFDDILKADIETGDALKVLSDLLDKQNKRDAARALRHIANAASGLPDIQFAHLVDAGAVGPQDRTATNGVKLSLNALDLSSAVLTLARDGRQLKLDFGATVPGVASLQAWLAIGQRPENSPWLAVTASGAPVIRTAQARLYITADVKVGGALATVSLPVLVELASAEAKLSAIACPSNPTQRRVTLAVRTGVGRAAIASIDRTKLDDFSRKLKETPAALVSVPLVSVTAQAGVDVGGQAWQSVTFTAADIDARTVKTVETVDALQSVTASLVGGLKLKVTILGAGLGLGDSAVQKTVATALSNAAAPVDSVINAVTGLLGLHLGEADLRLNGVRCHATALVL